jgi:hypothetical protein
MDSMRTNRNTARPSSLSLFVGAFAISLLAANAKAQTCNSTWTAGTGNLTTGCVVGMGTATPTAGYQFESFGSAARITRSDSVQGGGPQAALSLFHQTSVSSIDGFGVSILLYMRDTSAQDDILGRISGVRDGSDTTGKIVFALGTGTAGPNNATTDRFQITNTGVSAIGVPLTATYSDLAEWTAVKGSSDPGTVVVIHGGAVNELEPSRRAYDTGVAGVVSAKPGIVLGESGDGKATVATTGRVKVKVDASKGAIHVGDLLVTSDREGYAMKSEPVDVAGIRMHRPGTLIGKALEPLETGDGEILVLLSLQ